MRVMQSIIWEAMKTAVLAHMTPLDTILPAATCSIADLIQRHDGALSPLQLAKFTGMSRKTIYAKVKKGTIPAMDFDGSIKFDPYTVAAWIRSKSA
jgi:predicted DNA-binding transcriptional regulator AlpA